MTTKIYMFFFSLVCLLYAVGFYVLPIWYSDKYMMIIDMSEYKNIASGVALVLSAIFFYRGIKYDPKDGISFICPKCEEVFAYRDVKPLCNCPKCAVPLVPLKGYFKRKAWEERHKEKNSNTNA